MATKKEKEAILKLVELAEQMDSDGGYIDPRQELGTWRDGLLDAYECLN
jgi:hypothetical protein